MVHQNWGGVETRYKQICQLRAYLWHGLSKIKGIKCLNNSDPEAVLVSFPVTQNLAHKKIFQAFIRHRTRNYFLIPQTL